MKGNSSPLNIEVHLQYRTKLTKDNYTLSTLFFLLDINSSNTITNLSIKESFNSIKNLFLQESSEVTLSHHHLIAKSSHSISLRHGCGKPNSICRDLNKS